MSDSDSVFEPEDDEAEVEAQRRTPSKKVSTPGSTTRKKSTKNEVAVRTTQRLTKAIDAEEKEVVERSINKDRKQSPSKTRKSPSRPNAKDVGSSKSPAKTRSPQKNKPSTTYNVVIPPHVMNPTASSSCTVLVQIEPEQQNKFDLEFEGSSGAIGRFEANQDFVTLDLKGHQFYGILHPGPTAMILTLSKPKQSTETKIDGDQNRQQTSEFFSADNGIAKVDAISDEFVALHQIQDSFSKLHDIVDMGDMDSSFMFRDVDVNQEGSSGVEATKTSGENNDAQGGGKSNKRKASTGGSKRKSSSRPSSSKKKK